MTPKYFSISFLESVSNILASTRECKNDSAYCGRPMSGSHSEATHLNKNNHI